MQEQKKRTRKSRTRFSSLQLNGLEEAYGQNPYRQSAEVDALAEQLGLTRQIILVSVHLKPHSYSDIKVI